MQDRSIPELVRDVEFFSADAIIATGQRTGHSADLDYIRTIRSATSLPTLVGSGVTSENVGDILNVVDGVIVASALKVDGHWWNAVDPERANRFVDRARSLVPMTQGEVTFSEQMRSQTKAAWDAAIGHQFFREVANDTIDDRVFARYLKIEYGFVDCAASALGYAVTKAPSFRERRHLTIGLYGLVTDQEQFFVSAFDRMGVSKEAAVDLPPATLSGPLQDLFLGVAASEGYHRDSYVRVGGGVDVLDLVLNGRSHAFGATRRQGVGRAPRWRRLR